MANTNKLFNQSLDYFVCNETFATAYTKSLEKSAQFYWTGQGK